MAYCPNCGKTVDADVRFCSSCGRDLVAPVGSASASSWRQTTVVASPQIAPTLQYASITDRFIASVIDLILVAIATAVVAFPFGVAAWMGTFFISPFSALFSGLFFGTLAFLVWMAYFSYFESTSGQTLGKSAMSIKVVDQVSAGTVDIPRAAIRSFLRIIDFLPALYLIGFIVCLITPRRQRIGDVAAGTVVVKVTRL